MCARGGGERWPPAKEVYDDDEPRQSPDLAASPFLSFLSLLPRRVQ